MLICIFEFLLDIRNSSGQMITKYWSGKSHSPSKFSDTQLSIEHEGAHFSAVANVSSETRLFAKLISLPLSACLL